MNVMVFDEFQDTSDNFKLCSQGADSLIVGDVKQKFFFRKCETGEGCWGVPKKRLFPDPVRVETLKTKLSKRNKYTPF